MLLTQSSIVCMIAGPSVFLVRSIEYPNVNEIGIKLTALAKASSGSKPTANILCGRCTKAMITLARTKPLKPPSQLMHLV
jgi:hypothetical protein